MSRRERKEARKRRKAEKASKLAARLVGENVPSRPRVHALPPNEKRPKPGVRLAAIPPPKRPRVVADGGRFQTPMTWCARKADLEGSWSWGEQRQWTEAEWESEIFPGLNSHEGALWREIQGQTSGEGHYMHHDHDVAELCNEAMDRWLALELEEFDTVFRFRFGNTKRAWGIELQGHFYLVWWERYHRIYPTQQKHT